MLGMAKKLYPETKMLNKEIRNQALLGCARWKSIKSLLLDLSFGGILRALI
jgi:hypothetical protein